MLLSKLVTKIAKRKQHELDEWCKTIAEHAGLEFMEIRNNGTVIGQFGKNRRGAQQLRGPSYTASHIAPLAPGIKPILENLTSTHPNHAVALFDISTPDWPIVIRNPEWRDAFGDGPVFWTSDVSLRGGSKRSQLAPLLAKKTEFSLSVITHNGRDSHVMRVKYACVSSHADWSTRAAEGLYVAENMYSASSRTASLSTGRFEHAILPPPSLNCKDVKQIGRGSMGTVMRAIWQDYGEVAVKHTRSAVGPQRNAESMQELEALLGTQLQHPNVVRVLKHESIVKGGTRDTWQVMELCELGSLKSNLIKLDPDQLLPICRGIAKGMSYLHQQHIIHSDLNLANILLSGDGEPKVSDLGISRLSSGNPFSTNSLGTTNYMPPELLFQRELSPAADVYSFGVILWELWHRRLAWHRISNQEILQIKAQGARLEWTNGPTSVAALADRCCLKDPAARPSFDKICYELDQVS